MRYPIQRRPIIQPTATRYVLLLTLALATTVVVTRFYLEMTGYPQIGNATFHFAHALWGGLLQAIATILLLLFSNRWFKDLSAILAGVGVGLFIDEVGKFITQQNDYFFPLAAPIIYVTFLLIVFLYLAVQRKTAHADSRANMLAVLQDLEEVLDSDLSIGEKQAMLERLQNIRNQSSPPEIVALAEHLTTYLESGIIPLTEDSPSRLAALMARLTELETRLFPRQRTRRILVALFLLSSMATALLLVLLLGVLFDQQTVLPEFLRAVVLDERYVASATSASWFLAMTLVQAISGSMIFAGAIAFLTRRDRLAVGLGMISAIITLTITNTLSFYFNQFSVIVTSLAAFAILILMKRYRDRFLNGDAADGSPVD